MHLSALKSSAQHRWSSRGTAATRLPPARRPLRTAAVGFQPQMDPSVAAAQLAVLATTLGTAGYWWLVLVPSERVSLAKNKRKGETLAAGKCPARAWCRGQRAAAAPTWPCPPVLHLLPPV